MEGKKKQKQKKERSRDSQKKKKKKKEKNENGVKLIWEIAIKRTSMHYPTDYIYKKEKNKLKVRIGLLVARCIWSCLIRSCLTMIICLTNIIWNRKYNRFCFFVIFNFENICLSMCEEIKEIWLHDKQKKLIMTLFSSEICRWIVSVRKLKILQRKKK